MPARQAAYEDPKLRKQFPADLLALCQAEHRRRAARGRPSPYWSDISTRRSSTWHPADSVNPDSTPESSATFIEDALHGKVLL